MWTSCAACTRLSVSCSTDTPHTHTHAGGPAKTAHPLLGAYSPGDRLQAASESSPSRPSPRPRWCSGVKPAEGPRPCHRPRAGGCVPSHQGRLQTVNIPRSHSLCWAYKLFFKVYRFGIKFSWFLPFSVREKNLNFYIAFFRIT